MPAASARLLHRRRADVRASGWAIRSRTDAAARSPGDLARARHAGPCRLPAAGEQSGAPGRACAGRARRDGVGQGQRVLSADHLADLQRPGRHRRHQRDSRRAAVLFNFRFSTASTVEGLKARVAGDPRPPRARLCAGVVAVGDAVPDAARPAGRGDERRDPSESPGSSRSCPPPAAPPTGASSRHLPAGGRARPGERHHPPGRTSASRWPTWTRLPASTTRTAR